MRFPHFDSLRIFSEVARFGSFSAASSQLNLTKGALSYQIRILEQALGFEVFVRLPRGVVLTAKGRELSLALQTAFSSVESRIDALRDPADQPITIGTTTYFASRWLSARLMRFMRAYPEIRLRIQPLIDFSSLASEGIDVAIRWGRGNWPGQPSQLLFLCPAFATGASDALALVEAKGLQSALASLTLLADSRGSEAWAQWHRAAGLHFHDRADTLTIPDPNVRVQAVIDGQGVALNDSLVAQELREGKLVRLSPHRLDDYGYHLICEANASGNGHVHCFMDWIMGEAEAERR
ncbi:MAG: LysR substrate-binding domain-containing protein [Albidovulum sp.]